MTKEYVNYAQLSNTCFQNNTNIVSVDCNYLPWRSNSMSKAFNGCTSLQQVNNINENVQDVTYAFSGCSSLTDVPQLPNSIRSFTSAFSGCSSLTDVPQLPNSIYDMGWAFYGCSNLVNIAPIPNNVRYMSSTFFSCSNLVNASDMSNATNVINMWSTFGQCSSLVNAPVIPNNVTDMFQTFYGCSSLVDAPIIPNGVTNMSKTFNGCTKLVNAPDIPNSVTNMAYTFEWCNSLIDAPVIPNSVTDMYYTFACCSNLVNATTIPNSVTNMAYTFGWCRVIVNAPEIPNSVTDMSDTFYGCWKLVNVPSISNSVTKMGGIFGECFAIVNAPDMSNCTNIIDMRYAFWGCSKLTGNIYINSNQITNATNCFYSTSLTKNVYIPFKNSDGSNSATYNSFISAGYTTDGTTNGVYLKDINPSTQYTLTISPTPEDATVTLTAEGYTQSGNSITVEEGTTVNYEVSKDGYVTQSGSKVVTANETLDIELEEKPFDPSDLKFGDRVGGIATVVGNYVNGDGKEYVYAVLDAKYMNKTNWGVYGTDTDLPNYSELTSLLSSKESATYNTDYILSNYEPSDYSAFKHCNNCVSIELGEVIYTPKLPNANEMEKIYDNRNTLYALDPTTSEYTNYNLSNWNFDGCEYVWTSNEYDSSYAWTMHNGAWNCLNSYKNENFGVIPILEIPLISEPMVDLDEWEYTTDSEGNYILNQYKDTTIDNLVVAKE